MALVDPSNTLAYHGSRLLCTHRDMRNVPCATVAKAMGAYMTADKFKNTCPDSEALWFYGLNHTVALISERRAPLEPLTIAENELVLAYHARLGPKAVRAFYYLLWICTREARHLPHLDSFAPKLEQHGKGLQSFFTSINGGESGIAKKFLENPPPCTIGGYTKALCDIFYKASWGGMGGYGGPKWGAIAEVLDHFVNGVYTAEMMLDTNWTLCHNGGPIFNKGHFYKHHSSDLVRLLDVQRSGQIPEAVMSDLTLQQYAEGDLMLIMSQVYKMFPGKLGGCVDWLRVEALGSVNKYPSDIAAQHKAGKVTPEQKAALDKIAQDKAAKELAAKEEAAMTKADFQKKWFTIMPGVNVPKYQRVA